MAKGRRGEAGGRERTIVGMEWVWERIGVDFFHSFFHALAVFLSRDGARSFAEARGKLESGHPSASPKVVAMQARLRELIVVTSTTTTTSQPASQPSIHCQVWITHYRRGVNLLDPSWTFWKRPIVVWKWELCLWQFLCNSPRRWCISSELVDCCWVLEVGFARRWVLEDRERW